MRRVSYATRRIVSGGKAHKIPLAARIVLQRLVPGLRSIARRRGRRPDDGDTQAPDLFHDLLANAWIVIRCYPIERRPFNVAANLLKDVGYQTLTTQQRMRSVRLTDVALDESPHDLLAIASERIAPLADKVLGEVVRQLGGGQRGTNFVS